MFCWAQLTHFGCMGLCSFQVRVCAEMFYFHTQLSYGMASASMLAPLRIIFAPGVIQGPQSESLLSTEGVISYISLELVSRFLFVPIFESKSDTPPESIHIPFWRRWPQRNAPYRPTSLQRQPASQLAGWLVAGWLVGWEGWYV